MAETKTVFLWLNMGKGYEYTPTEVHPLTENFAARFFGEAWSITHLPTGLNLNGLFYGYDGEFPASLDHCQRIADALEGVGEWSKITCDADKYGKGDFPPRVKAKIKSLGKKTRPIIAKLADIVMSTKPLVEV